MKNKKQIMLTFTEEELKVIDRHALKVNRTRKNICETIIKETLKITETGK
jgi:hypothetical protein